MADRYDILTARESNGKTYWTKLGAMFSNKSGEGFTIMLDAIPASNEGQYRLTAMVPKPRDDQQRGNGGSARQQQPAAGGFNDDLGDDIPFLNMQGTW